MRLGVLAGAGLLMATVATPAAASPSTNDLDAAIRARDVAAIQAWVAAGGDINAGRCHALPLATRTGDPALVHVLMAMGARVARSALSLDRIAVQADLNGVKLALQLYRLDHGRFPTPAEFAAWQEPQVGTRDAWGHPWRFEVAGGRVVDVFTLGADDAPGGSGYDADVHLDPRDEDEAAAARSSDPDGACERAAGG